MRVSRRTSRNDEKTYLSFLSFNSPRPLKNPFQFNLTFELNVLYSTKECFGGGRNKEAATNGGREKSKEGKENLMESVRAQNEIMEECQKEI